MQDVDAPALLDPLDSAPDADVVGRLSPTVVIRETLRHLRRRAVVLALTGLLLWAGPMMALNLVAGRWGAALWPAYPLLGFLVVVWLGTEVLAAAFRGGMIPLIWGDIESAGREGAPGLGVSLGEVLVSAVWFWLPCFLVGVISSLAYLVTAPLLVAPMLVLACLWMVAAPAVVIERRGPIDALKRSVELGRGNRWRVFGTIAIFWAAAIGLSAVASIVSVLFDRTGAGPYPAMALNAVVGALNGVVGLVGVVVLYDQLRRCRAGETPGRLAEVFG